MRKAGLANLVRISAVHCACLPTGLSFQPGLGALRSSAHHCPQTRDPVALLGSWVDFTSVEGGTELGGRWDNCGEVDSVNTWPGRAGPWRRGGLGVREPSSWLWWEPGGSEVQNRQEGGQVGPGRSVLCRQAEVAFNTGLPFLSSATLGSDGTSFSQFPSLKKKNENDFLGDLFGSL